MNEFLNKLIKFLSNNWEAITALCAIGLSLFSTYISFRSFKVQRKHNMLSVKPLLHVGQFDYENCIKITLSNNGVGPAIVQSLKVFNSNNDFQTSIFKWLPDKLPGKMNYKEYLTIHENFAIKTGETKIMLELPIDPKKNKEISTKESIRSILRDLTVKVEFEDIYKNRMDPYKLKLYVYSRNDHVN